MASLDALKPVVCYALVLIPIVPDQLVGEAGVLITRHHMPDVVKTGGIICGIRLADLDAAGDATALFQSGVRKIGRLIFIPVAHNRLEARGSLNVPPTVIIGSLIALFSNTPLMQGTQ